MLQAIEENRTVGLKTNCILIRRDGVETAIEDAAAPIHDRGGKVTGAVIVFHEANISRDAVKKMTHLAHHDFLTTLPNRILFGDRVANMIALAHRRSNQLALQFLDIDNFKHINDSMGHLIGDKAIQSVAQRLVECVRSSDTVSLHGGDEFVVMLAEIEHTKDAVLIAEKMLLAVTTPLIIDNVTLQLTVSIGISIFPDDGQDAETLISCADTAMYHAKYTGRNNFQFFTERDNVQFLEQQVPKKQTVL